MAGKEGVFEVTVKEVRRRLPAAIDDTLAEAVGLESLDELRQEIRQRMQRDYDRVARQRLKRALLDKLAERLRFPGSARHGRDGVQLDLGAIRGREARARQQIAARAAGQHEAENGRRGAGRWRQR